MSRTPLWTLSDVLDFECLLAADAGEDSPAVAQRDRKIFAERVANSLPASQRADRSAIFHAWIEARRSDAKEGLPGEAFDAGWRLVLAAGLIGGLLLGATLGATLLRYPGSEPVNIWVFLGATLGPQFLLPLGAAVLWRVLRLRPGEGLLSRLICGLGGELRRLPGEPRQRLRAALATLGKKRELFGSLTVWPLVIVTQVFAVAFNLGVLGALLSDVPTRELRFGWQTTLEVPTEKVAQAIGVVSSPWSWAPAARPSAEQIAATRFAPGQGHASLSGEAMRAWWPFLAYAVAFYGLLLRGAVLVFALWRRRVALRNLRFDHAEANALWRRLTGPLVETRNDTRALVIPENGPSREASPAFHAGTGLALVAAEFEFAEAELADGVRRLFGWELEETVPVKIDSRREATPALETLRQKAGQVVGIVVVIPASRDPIVAIALFLREVVSAAAGKPEIVLLLVGDRVDGSLAAVPAERLKFWRAFNAIHGLHLGLESWRAA